MDIYHIGYHTVRGYDYTNRLSIDVLLAFPSISAHAPEIAFDVKYFEYIKK